MSSCQSILISLERRHANNVLSGSKTVEFRRRRMDVGVGATVWIYEKMPAGRVVGTATVAAVFYLTPAYMWRKFSSVAGLSKAEFFQYFEGVDKGFAVLLRQPTVLCSPVPLSELRLARAGFQPPQFFMRLHQRDSIFAVLSHARLPNRSFEGCESEASLC